MNTIHTMRLKNGEELPTPLVTATMMNLQSLLDNDPIGFYELVTLCRNPRHKLWGRNNERLIERGLLEPTGAPHDALRSIVLSAVTGDDEDMTLGSPTS